MRALILSFIGRILCVVILIQPGLAAFAQNFSVSGFVRETAATGAAGMTAFDFGPNGRIYAAEKRGRVMLFETDGNGGYNSPSVFLDIRSQVNSELERGMLGIALDPDFVNNRIMYLLYSTSTDQRIVRVVASTDLSTASGSPENVLTGLPNQNTFHKSGHIKFRSGEPQNLYISIGDDGRPSDAPDLSKYEGKILRINKSTGGGVSDNPFVESGNLSTIRSRIWSLGHRNPFRFAFHPDNPVANIIYVSENGQSTDKLSWVEIGSNGNWELSGQDDQFLNPPNNGPGEGIHKILATDSAAMVGVLVTRGGAFADPEFPQSDTILLANWIGNNIKRWRLTGANLDTAVPIAADNGGAFLTNSPGAVDMKIGPDGWLYMTHAGVYDSIDSGKELYRIKFANGAAPVSSFVPQLEPTSGDVPLSVSFTNSSFDPDTDGSIISHFWDFGDGNFSSVAEPTHMYTAPGRYSVTLTVTDNSGQQATSQFTIDAIQLTSISLSGQIYDVSSGFDNTLAEGTEVRLYDHLLQPLSFTNGSGVNENVQTIPAGGSMDFTMNAEVNGPHVVISIGEPINDGVQPLLRGLGISGDTEQNSFAFDLRLSSAAVSGKVTNVSSIPLAIDIGTSKGAPGSLYTVPGGRDYLASSGIPQSGVLHRVDSDLFGYYYIPIVAAEAGDTFFFDVVADTNSANFISQFDSVSVASNQLISKNYILGEIGGGGSCDDLSSIPVMQSIDYESSIQPIFNTCTGCHGDVSPNGDLSLTGNSQQKLIEVLSGQVPGLNLVTLGNLEQSYLFEKINCASPQVGARMRIGFPMPLEDQALIRDWILQEDLGTIDTDGDGVPDDLDADDDGDSVLDTEDNCPLDSNLDQLDSNMNGIGDACEPSQGDEICFPLTTNQTGVLSLLCI